MLKLMNGPRLDPNPADAPGGPTTISPPGSPPAPAPAPSPEPKQPAPSPETAAQMVRLQKFRDESAILMRKDTDPVRREEAARFVLSEQGYTPEQVDAWINERRAPAEPAPTDNGEKPDPRDLRMDQMAQELQETRVQQIRDAMNGSLTTHLDGRGEIPVLLKDLEKFYGEKAGERVPKVREVLKKRLLKETVEELTLMKNREGRLDLTKIPGVVEKKAKELVEEYRAALPDPSLIGRSGETDLGEEEFLKLPPVKTPEYKKGMTVGTAQTDIKSWITDSLSRLAVAGPEDGTRA